jgi:hypothetical protein
MKTKLLLILVVALAACTQQTGKGEPILIEAAAEIAEPDFISNPYAPSKSTLIPVRGSVKLEQDNWEIEVDALDPNPTIAGSKIDIKYKLEWTESDRSQKSDEFTITVLNKSYSLCCGFEVVYDASSGTSTPILRLKYPSGWEEIHREEG